MDTEKQRQRRRDDVRLTENGNARSKQLNTRGAYRVANQQSLAWLSGSERRRPGWFLDMKYQTCSIKTYTSTSVRCSIAQILFPYHEDLGMKLTYNHPYTLLEGYSQSRQTPVESPQSPCLTSWRCVCEIQCIYQPVLGRNNFFLMHTTNWAACMIRILVCYIGQEHMQCTFPCYSAKHLTHPEEEGWIG